MSPNPPAVRLELRTKVREKLVEIKSYVDEQHGNDPEDTTGLKTVQKLLEGLGVIRQYPWLGSRIKDLGENFRQYRIGKYMFSYYVVDPKALILVIELRHTSQKPLVPATLRKYKREMESDLVD
jgi:hypothetical protein